MKISYGIVVILFLLSSSFMVLTRMESPELLLAGKWQEVEWEYERTNHTKDRQEVVISGEQKKEICSQLIIHNDPEWEFDVDQRILTIGDKEQLSWSIKGRGHLLELNGVKGTENYQIVELTQDKLVLYVNFDLQIRGIIKMTFKRIG